MEREDSQDASSSDLNLPTPPWYTRLTRVIRSVGSGIGGPVAAFAQFWSETEAAREVERLREAIEGFAADMERLEGRLDDAYLQDDRFAYLFARAMRATATERVEVKRLLIRKLLVNNALSVGDAVASEDEFVLGLLESLTLTHFTVLQVLEDHGGGATAPLGPFRRTSASGQRLPRPRSWFDREHRGSASRNAHWGGSRGNTPKRDDACARADHRGVGN